MSFLYTYAKSQIIADTPGIDLDNDDIEVMLVMSNTTADTEEDKEHVADFTTLDEMDGVNYARQNLANPAISVDTANDRALFDADDQLWNALGNGARQVQAALIYKNTGAAATDIPIAYIDVGGFPFDPGGDDVAITWHATGIIQGT